MRQLFHVYVSRGVYVGQWHDSGAGLVQVLGAEKVSWARNVFSSHVSEVAWDEDSNSMIVTWKNGRRSAYIGVTEAVALECSKAASVGTYLNNEIKPYYEHRYV